MTEPVCWIVAGPNGAGKTTFALDYLPQVAGCRQFVNADLIAAGLSPLAPERELVAASRLFLAAIKDAIGQREDFAFETTLSGRTYLRMIQRLRREGWRVELVYLALPSVEMARLRVAERVTHGGHSISTHDIECRFPRSLRNLFLDYAHAADHTRCLMNAGPMPGLVFEQHGEAREVLDETLYRHLLKEADL